MPFNKNEEYFQIKAEDGNGEMVEAINLQREQVRREGNHLVVTTHLEVKSPATVSIVQHITHKELLNLLAYFNDE